MKKAGSAWKLGITGYPLVYTQSPKLHRAFLREAGLKGSYDVLPFDPSGGRARFFRFLDGLSRKGYRGINVTVPLKEWAFEYAGRPAPGFHGRCAKLVGAANTLIFSHGRVTCANTDASGLWDDIEAWLGCRVRRFNVLIVGTGGAARGALAGVLAGHPATKRVARVSVIGRQPFKALALEKLLPKSRRGFGIVTVNASGPRSRMLPTLVLWCLPPLTEQAAHDFWYDLVGETDPTRFFLYDLNYGKRAAPTRRRVAPSRRRDGMGMLKRQARASFELWS